MNFEAKNRKKTKPRRQRRWQSEKTKKIIIRTTNKAIKIMMKTIK